ncbi:MAG: hypothetical protein ABIP08_07150 [Lautropia sp.]
MIDYLLNRSEEIARTRDRRIEPDDGWWRLTDEWRTTSTVVARYLRYNRPSGPADIRRATLEAADRRREHGHQH